MHKALRHRQKLTAMHPESQRTSERQLAQQGQLCWSNVLTLRGSIHFMYGIYEPAEEEPWLLLENASLIYPSQRL